MADQETRTRPLHRSRLAYATRPRTLRFAHIVGWGFEVPSQVLSNADLEAIVDTNDEWITTRTGIKERRIAEPRETTTSLATRAAQKALDVADLLPSAIDLIIVATATPEYIFPSTASMVQDYLGATNAGAFDLSAACSGFVYALDMAASKIRTGEVNCVVVIGAETLSRVLDWTDRGTCILFGDGAGAVVLQGSDTPGGILSSVLRSDGSGWDMLTLPTVSARDTYLQDGLHEMHRIYMDGKGVYRFATRIIGESIKAALDQAGLTADDLALVIPHQANQRIIEYAAKALKIPEDRVYSNIARYGNTSAASIPLALAEAAEQNLLKPGDIVAFVGFGGGLSWAAMIVEWSVLPSRPTRSLTWGRRQGQYALAWLRRPLVRLWRRILSLNPQIMARRARERAEEARERAQVARDSLPTPMLPHERLKRDDAAQRDGAARREPEASPDEATQQDSAAKQDDTPPDQTGA